VVRRLAVVATVALAVAGCGSSQTYSVDEVIASFAKSGYPLVMSELPRGYAAIEGNVLRPRDGGNVMVLVLSDAEARQAWADFVRLGPDADSFDALRGALDDLPDRGDAVSVISQETA
jgi:hypothetical protein